MSRADDVRVTVLKTNAPPVVWAGPNQTIIDPDPVYLPGAVFDDGAPVGGVLTVRWAGPAGVEFINPGVTNAFARFPGPGVYPLTLSASDGMAAQGGLAAKTDAIKVKMAARLRAETVMTLDWIAGRLEMGCRHTVAHCLKG